MILIFYLLVRQKIYINAEGINKTAVAIFYFAVAINETAEGINKTAVAIFYFAVATNETPEHINKTAVTTNATAIIINSFAWQDY